MNCKKLEFPIVKIPQDIELYKLKDYFDAKLNCIANTKSNNIIDSTTDRIIKLNNNFESKLKNDSVFTAIKAKSNFYPVFIIEKDIGRISIEMLMDPENTNFDLNISDCTLCKTSHNLGFKKPIKVTNFTLFGNYIPQLDDTNLIFRNFIIIFNPYPYLPDHLMIMTQNHDKLGVKGSQYEILNKEILSDVIDVFIQISSDYFMGHNYALSGSQIHFHIHIFKKQFNVNYGMDNCIEFLAQDIQNNITAKLYNYSKTIQDMDDEIEYTCYVNENNEDIRIAEFKNKMFGYKGYVIMIPKISIITHTTINLKAKQHFINVIFNFLNWIENSIEYSFGLYFPSSVNFFSVVVLVQSREIAKNASMNIDSFINFFKLIFNDKIIQINNKDSDILCESVFGNNSCIDNKKYKFSFLISFENRLINKKYLDNFTFILSGFTGLNNMIKLPYFYWRLFETNIHSFQSIKDIPVKNISCVISNSKSIRNNILIKLHNKIHIDFGGSFMNNIPKINGSHANDNLIEFYKQYKFGITFENSIGEYYITEKIFT
jgi:hypothetical protein